MAVGVNLKRLSPQSRYMAQQMSEYSVVIALIAVSFIVVLSMFGTAISSGIKSMIGDMNRPAPGSLGNEPIAASAGQAGAQKLSSADQVGIVGNLPLTYTSSAQETTGANGATELMANQLLDIGKQHLALGEITREQYNLFETLANTGHQMAAVEGMIESAATNAGNYDEFMNTPVVYNGQNMTIGRLTDYIGTSNGMDNSSPLSYKSQPSKTLETFIDAYSALKSSGALNNATINQQVTSLANNIALLNGSFDNTRLMLQTQSKYSPDILKKIGAPYISNLNSMEICQTGNSSCRSQTH